MELFLTFAFVGFFAQLADSALGMGFGVISSSVLLAQGVPPPLVSASVNAAKVPTGIAAGISHAINGNIDKRLFLRLALAGVAVETAIVMLLYLNLAWEKRKNLAAEAQRKLTTDDVEEVVFEGALLRVRPKVMTVATIFAGLIPIMYGQGTGSEIMQRIAAPMVGGMATATLLTLFVIPSIFVIWKRLALTRVNRTLLQEPGREASPVPAE